MAYPSKSLNLSDMGRVLVVTHSEEPGTQSSENESCLETLVQRRLGARIRKLRIILRHDGVVLQGMASTYYAKQLAQHAAMDLGELPIVANEIEVC